MICPDCLNWLNFEIVSSYYYVISCYVRIGEVSFCFMVVEPRWFLVETLGVWMERAYVKLSVEVIETQFADHGLFRRDLGSGKANSQEWEWNFQSQEWIFYPYFECRSGFRPILPISAKMGLFSSGFLNQK